MGSKLHKEDFTKYDPSRKVRLHIITTYEEPDEDSGERVIISDEYRIHLEGVGYFYFDDLFEAENFMGWLCVSPFLPESHPLPKIQDEPDPIYDVEDDFDEGQ